jgi:nucleoside-diphosphate-sugar epimerase
VYLNLNYNVLDVRDVASSILLAMEREDIRGRYCMSSEAISLEDVLKIAKENFPKLHVPTRKAPDFMIRMMVSFDYSNGGACMRHSLGKKTVINAQKAKDAGLMTNFRSLNETVVDTIRYAVLPCLSMNEFLLSLFSLVQMLPGV